jgi:hypothetical protein
VRQALRAERQAAAVSLGKRAKDGAEPLVTLLAHQLFFWSGRRIDARPNLPLMVPRASKLSQHLFASLQRQVVRNLEQPSVQIRLVAIQREMPKQREERVLNDVFGLLHSEPKRPDVPQQLRRAPIEQGKNVRFDRVTCRWDGCSWQQGNVDERIGGVCGHASNSGFYPPLRSIEPIRSRSVSEK